MLIKTVFISKTVKYNLNYSYTQNIQYRLFGTMYFVKSIDIVVRVIIMGFRI